MAGAVAHDPILVEADGRGQTPADITLEVESFFPKNRKVPNGGQA